MPVAAPLTPHAMTRYMRILNHFQNVLNTVRLSLLMAQRKMGNLRLLCSKTKIVPSWSVGLLALGTEAGRLAAATAFTALASLKVLFGLEVRAARGDLSTKEYANKTQNILNCMMQATYTLPRGLSVSAAFLPVAVAMVTGAARCSRSRMARASLFSCDSSAVKARRCIHARDTMMQLQPQSHTLRFSGAALTAGSPF